jgi:hypothetical protein
MTTRIGITGHRDLTPQTVHLLTGELANQLSKSSDEIVGISCLAEGADHQSIWNTIAF